MRAKRIASRQRRGIHTSVLSYAAAAAVALIARQGDAGTTGSEVTISLSGSTAMRNFTKSSSISLVTPGSQVSVGGTLFPSSPTFWNNPSNSFFQLAPGAFPGASASAADALRLEWHEQGSVEGILEMANDQIGAVASITASNRNASSGNPIWVNGNSFSSTSTAQLGNHPLGQMYAVVGATSGQPTFTLSGLNSNGGQNAVQMAISDVTSRQGFSVSGGASSYTLTPGQPGFGKGNQALAAGLTTQGLGQAGVRHELVDQSALNMAAAANNPRTGAAFGAGPWNTAGVDNTDNQAVAITATLFVANPGTGLDRINRTDAQFLQAVGRLPNGADFNVTTRDVNSGTLNVAALNVGLDPSFAVGENDNGNGNDTTTATTAQINIGPGIKFSNKTAGGGQLRPTVQNSRMAIGHLSMSDAIGSTKQSTATPLRALSFRDDADDLANNSNNVFRPVIPTGDARDTYTDPAAGEFVNASGSNILSGKYVAYQNETYVTLKKPGAAFAGDSAAQWAARTSTATGIQGDTAANDVGAFRNNVLNAVVQFGVSTNLASALSPADGLLATSFILPQIMGVKKAGDGINQSFPNSQNAALAAAFLDPTNGVVQSFNPSDPNTVTLGSGAKYGGVTPAGTGAINITAQNYLFGNFRQNGVRDFEAIKSAQDAQAKLFASGAGVDMFSGGANSTVVAGVAAPLAAMTNQAGGVGATKGDLIVMGDFNSDGKFDGKDLYLLARGAALSDSAAVSAITLAGGETLGAGLRRAVLRKNAALDYMQASATPQQKLDASAVLSNDPTGANAFNKYDVNRDGLVSRKDAKTVDQFVGKDYRVLQNQLDAVLDGAPISLVDVELNDTGTITHVAPLATDVSDTKLIILALQGRDVTPARTGNEHDATNKLINGDANFDGTVDGADFSFLAASFGQSSKKWSNGDFNFDGSVDGADFSLLAANFGFTAGSGTPGPIAASDLAALTSFGQSVPEPSTLGALALGGIAALARRRFRRTTRLLKGLAVLAAVAFMGASDARAAAITFVNVPITADAVTDDASLAGRVTTDMKVTIPTGFDWSNSAVEIVLTQGTVYNATNAAGTDSAPNPALWGIPTLRNGQFDTFVTTKNFGNASIVGSFHNGADLPPPAEGLTTANASAVRVSWGDTALGEDGTFTIGRFTFSSNAAGTFNGRTFSSEAPGVGVPFTGTIVNGALAVPEPASVALLGVGEHSSHVAKSEADRRTAVNTHLNR